MDDSTMDPDAAREFLRERGHGVLSLGHDDDAYGLPVSFGYDGDARRLVFHLVFGPDSRKERFLERCGHASLTAHDWRTPDDWQSVVVRGPLDELGADPDFDTTSAFAADAAPVGLTAFGTPASDLDSRWYALSVDSLTGRRGSRRTARN